MTEPIEPIDVVLVEGPNAAVYASVVAEPTVTVAQVTEIPSQGPTGPVGPQGPEGPASTVPGPPGGQWEDIREYTASVGGVTTPAGISGGYVTVISGGGGGGSGRRGAANTVRCGGGGGGTAAQFEIWVPASLWGATYNVGVGAGGTGGAAVAADNTDGYPGQPGANSSVSTGSVVIDARSTAGGAGGTATSGGGGAGNLGVGVSGGSASTTGGVGGDGLSAETKPGGGAAGGGITSGNSAWKGGFGGCARSSHYSVANPGAVDGALPQPGVNYGLGMMGSGAAGGSASFTKAAQDGPAGGDYGGGGAGGGASLNGFTSGAGGKGGNGYARIRFVYLPSAALGGDVVRSADIGLLAVGQETMPRWAATGTGVGFVAGATGRARFAFFTARKTETVNALRVVLSAGAGATPSLVKLGLYSVAANGDLTRIGVTANNPTLFAAAGPAQQVLLAPVNVVTGQLYVVAALVVTAASLPSLYGVASVTNAEVAMAPRLGAYADGQSDLAASYSAATVLNTATYMYAVVTP